MNESILTVFLDFQIYAGIESLARLLDANYRRRLPGSIDDRLTRLVGAKRQVERVSGHWQPIRLALSARRIGLQVQRKSAIAILS